MRTNAIIKTCYFSLYIWTECMHLCHKTGAVDFQFIMNKYIL